ncbi:uncharacterized protein MONOS_2566 [Monocercomonoides exilis]|uniref:uncharacterized protein n=1 Tax=Monocercomonoides exilis TaxID=2049356 RepID=UPI00355A6815|nr:hypothetical protein MONOS_2566 [Monocercomonoides exilis]|eukprot:MONOS_2566.1-p1 / transcript=MONOS_2566.1 / gene=MONOS_2566 / organism=Monocercomonoides_exilis_PA203 / gene_product=unspecified product / transcript_product=unspecified product / location=Mono_scaffold00053:152094-154124(+) / protein_length=536 / sequence_SO=supercontig / SO=protein_coding / is_pseudo=false
MTIRQETAALCEMRSETEVQKQNVNIGYVMSLSDQEKERERENTGDLMTEISREDTQHKKNRRRLITSPLDRTEEQSEIREGEMEGSLESFFNYDRVPNWERPGGELEDSYCRYSRRRREYTDATWPQDTRCEGEYSEGTTEGATSWETGERAELVVEDWGRQTKRKEKKDPGLQGSKRGSAGKTLQDGFTGDSGGHPGEERLDDHSAYIECIPRKVESEASDILGLHSPHASRQGSFEIDLTGDSPVPEESGLDSVGGKTEVGTRKERGVSGMVVELRKDGSGAPRKEESAAPGGCANLDSTCKENEESENKRLSSTSREAEFCEAAAPTSEPVIEAHVIRAEAGNSLRGLERNCKSQHYDAGRNNTLEKDSAREQTKVSEEKDETSRTCNGYVRAGLGCRECVSDKREGIQSSVEYTREKGSIAATTEDRPYSSEDRQYVHEMDNTEEEVSSIAHSNTESIREETEQPGHYNTDGTSHGRAEHGSRCTQPDGEKAGLCTEGGESRRDISNNSTENTRSILEQIVPVPCGSTWK